MIISITFYYSIMFTAHNFNHLDRTSNAKMKKKGTSSRFYHSLSRVSKHSFDSFTILSQVKKRGNKVDDPLIAV